MELDEGLALVVDRLAARIDSPLGLRELLERANQVM